MKTKSPKSAGMGIRLYGGYSAEQLLYQAQNLFESGADGAVLSAYTILNALVPSAPFQTDPLSSEVLAVMAVLDMWIEHPDRCTDEQLRMFNTILDAHVRKSRAGFKAYKSHFFETR